jgi:hypothetical protein
VGDCVDVNVEVWSAGEVTVVDVVELIGVEIVDVEVEVTVEPGVVTLVVVDVDVMVVVPVEVVPVVIVVVSDVRVVNEAVDVEVEVVS